MKIPRNAPFSGNAIAPVTAACKLCISPKASASAWALGVMGQQVTATCPTVPSSLAMAAMASRGFSNSTMPQPLDLFVSLS